MTEWPDDIFEFAFIPDPVVRIRELSEEAEQEDWSYHHTETEHHHPLPFNFIRYTYRRVAEERKIAISDDGQYTCFNTGLVTPHQEPIYASFEANRREDVQGCTSEI